MIRSFVGRQVLQAGVLALALTAGSAGTGHAQGHALQQGAFRVGGSGSFTSAEVRMDGESLGRETRIGIAPFAQYFIVPNFAVGGTVTLDRRSAEGRAITSFGLGPSATYYFHAPGRTLHPYLSAGATIGRTRSEFQNVNFDVRMSGARAAAGLLYLVMPSVGLTGELFYDRFRQTSEETPISSVQPELRTDLFGFAAGFSIFIF